MKNFFPALLGWTPLFAENGSKGGRQQSLTQTLVMIGIALVFFYFIMWRPEQKRRKKMQNLRGNLKKGDKVTAMGIIGIVSQVKDTTVVLKMVDGAKIECLKAAITEIQPASEVDNKEVEETSAEQNS